MGATSALDLIPTNMWVCGCAGVGMWMKIQLVTLYLLCVGVWMCCRCGYVGADPASDVIPTNMWVCGCVCGCRSS